MKRLLWLGLVIIELCLLCLLLFAGLSLKSQELTATFLAVRLYCSLVMEYDIHTILDLATLAATLWVIFMIRFKLKASYMEDKDTLPLYYVVSVSIWYVLSSKKRLRLILFLFTACALCCVSCVDPSINFT